MPRQLSRLVFEHGARVRPQILKIGKALSTAHAIESGWIQINQGVGQSPGHSYGGFKQSGIGREFSLEGIDHFFPGATIFVIRPTLVSPAYRLSSLSMTQ